MNENVKGLCIEGKCFTPKSELSFFPKGNDRISVIYGRNGSGKSTIAAGFELIASHSESEEIKASLLKSDTNNFEYESIRNLYVFDEKFVERNVRIDSAGLGTIVLFGEQVGIEDEIDKVKEQKEKELVNISGLLDLIKKYKDKKDIISPEYQLERITNILSSDWAERVRIIKSNKIKAQVTYDVITEICSLENPNSVDELEIEYKQTFDLFSRISDSSVTYPNKIEQLVIGEEIETILIEKLGRLINKPTLTEREKLILASINEGNQKRIEESLYKFEDEKTDFCPYCYQNLSITYKKELVKSISTILNKEVDEHKKELEKLYIKPIQLTIDLYTQLNCELSNKIISQITNCNIIIQKYNDLVTRKIENTYLPIKTEPLGLNSSIKELNDLLDQLEVLRIDFNDARKRRLQIQNKLLQINKYIACKRIKTEYKAFLKQNQEQGAVENSIRDTQKRIDQYNVTLNNLNAKKEDVGIAIDNINNDLKYIFFSDSCISIELHNNMYYIKAYGNHVKPKDVSSGERNIIGLCYFFTQIMSRQTISGFYNQEQFIVIDDPISSFDFENKIGMLSYLKAQIKRIIVGNENSKVIIMSHDLTTIFDLRKAMDEIKKHSTKEADFSVLELFDKSLKQFNYSRSEYAELLDKVYNYANDRTGIDSLSIGNSMRRVLEAFSTFNYKKGIEEISCDQEILKEFKDKSQYFEALMYRLVLHSESHLAERVRSMQDGFNFFNFISDEEKQKTARSILCLMNILNSRHISSYLCTTAIANIRQWCGAIPNNDDINKSLVVR